MDEKVEINFDQDFKKYLQILRPYLGQLNDQNEINICNSWIQKLTDCKKSEKALRNKYIFYLCYQLAKGTLDEPFLMPPPLDDLSPLEDVSSSGSSFTEVEYIVIDSEIKDSKRNSDKDTPSQIFTDSGINMDKNKETSCSDTNCVFQNIFPMENIYRAECKPILKNYNLPNIHENFSKCIECDENYQYRANNVIMKLREMKKQNLLLHHELITLRQESKRDLIDESLGESILKVDNMTSTHNFNQENATISCLKCQLQELQNSRNSLIETIGSLQEKLDYYNSIKEHEIEEIEAKHKLEIIKLKTLTREEVKVDFENKLDELKKQYEKLILEMQSCTKEEIERFYKCKEEVIAEKDKLLQMREIEISNLKHQLGEVKTHQFSVLNRFLDGSNENRNDSAKNYELEKRLYKMERMKNKCAKAYEAKVASLQREKHLAECSLQLQLVKQRAQVLNDVTEENQVELVTALDKLENKYKEIVANVQATAVQRRVQDQIALGSLIQAVCGGISKDNSYVMSTNVPPNQFTANTVKNQNKERQRNCDREIGTLCNNNRVDNVIVENKSFGNDSVVPGYCLDSAKLQELFERAHIPQRDIGDLPK